MVGNRAHCGNILSGSNQRTKSELVSRWIIGAMSLGSIDASEDRRMRRARGRRIHDRDRGPTVGENRGHHH